MSNEVNYAKQMREKNLIQSLDFNATHEFNNRKPQSAHLLRSDLVVYYLG